MKKMKALFLTLAIGLTFATAATAVACKKDGGEDQNWFSGEVEDLVSIQFDEKEVNVYQYESVQLLCVANGNSESVQYTSSNPSVATVDENGLVTAQGVVGTAVITATVEGVSDTCTVSVQKSPYSPKIVADETSFTIEQGETLKFEVATLWNNQELTGEIAYTVTAKDVQEGQVTVTAEGNVISITPNAVLDVPVEIIVSTTVRGIYTSEIFTVEVVEASLKLQPTNPKLMPASGLYQASIATTAEIDGYTNELALDFVARQGSEVFEDVEILWEIVEGECAQIVENKKIVGVKAGTVTVKGTTTVGGETATVNVVCEVISPVVKLDQKIQIEVQNLAAVTLEGNIIGELQSVKLHGNSIENKIKGQKVNFLAENFPKKASLLGKQQLEFCTDVVTYIVDAEIYTMIINNADELDQMRIIADTGEKEFSTKQNKEVSSERYDGYFILGNDIAYNKDIVSMTDTGSIYQLQGKWQDLTRGFRGIFDGCGYNIDGMTVGNNKSGKGLKSTECGGVFGYLAAEGIVRNVSFTNATLLTNNGFICTMGDGLIENVSISYKKIGGDKSTRDMDTQSPRTMGSFFSFSAGINATVRNCLIDASAAEITLESSIKTGTKLYNVKMAGAAKNTENVILICPDKIVLDTSNADITRYSYTEIIEDSKLFNAFDRTIWTLENGIPMFVKQAESLDKNRAINFITTQEKLLVGFEMLVKVDHPYAKLEVEQTEGITLVNGTLKATEAAFGKTVTITATSLLNPEITATHRVYIDSYGKKVEAPTTEESVTLYNNNPVLEIGANDWLGEENYVYLGSDIVGQGTNEIVIDYVKLDWGMNDLVVVSVKNGEREYFEIKINLNYVKGESKNSVIASDSFFDPYRGSTIVDNADAGEAPEGFERVARVDSSTAWTTGALGQGYTNRNNFGEYTDLFFAVRLENGSYVFQGERLYSDNWVDFHCTQTSSNLWVVEANIDGKVYTQTDVDGAITPDNINAPLNSLGALLYRDGWANGFLFYRNPNNQDVTTSVYATEVRGIPYPPKGEKVIESALEEAEKSTSAVPSGYENVYETSLLNKGDFSSANLQELGYNKYRFMMCMSANLQIPELYAVMDTSKYLNVVVQQTNAFFLVELTKTETGWSIFMDITPSYQKIPSGTGWEQPTGRGYTFESTKNTLSEIFGEWYGWKDAIVCVTEVRADT